jgi:hypothetical protein
MLVLFGGEMKKEKRKGAKCERKKEEEEKITENGREKYFQKCDREHIKSA